MNFTYKSVEQKKTSSTYEVHISYEHGDADQTTHGVVKLKKANEEKLRAFIDHFQLMAMKIYNNRCHGSDLPKNFSEQEGIDPSLHVPLELDLYAMEYTSNYYAEMEIESIFFFDSSGNKFEVSWKE